MVIVYVCIFILAVAICVNIVLNIAMWHRLDNFEKKSVVLEKLVYEVAMRKIAMSDLKEFEKLDGYLKDAYVKYIVNLAMPIVIEKINTLGKNMNLETMIKENDEKIKASIEETLTALTAGV